MLGGDDAVPCVFFVLSCSSAIISATRVVVQLFPLYCAMIVHPFVQWYTGCATLTIPHARHFRPNCATIAPFERDMHVITLSRSGQRTHGAAYFSPPSVVSHENRRLHTVLCDHVHDIRDKICRACRGSRNACCATEFVVHVAQRCGWSRQTPQDGTFTRVLSL
jgi:hypothetical protein